MNCKRLNFSAALVACKAQLWFVVLTGTNKSIFFKAFRRPVSR